MKTSTMVIIVILALAAFAAYWFLIRPGVKATNVAQAIGPIADKLITSRPAPTPTRNALVSGLRAAVSRVTA